MNFRIHIENPTRQAGACDSSNSRSLFLGVLFSRSPNDFPDHRLYPYLLRGVIITGPDHVWSTDLTYVRLPTGFLYLVASLDWYSRQALAWRPSNTLETRFCLDCLEDALRVGRPSIFNSDRGVRFTSTAFAGRLAAEGIRISMDGRGRAHDHIFVERLWRSVKYEDVYPRGYQTVAEAYHGLRRYFEFYNHQRLHQDLGYPNTR